MPTRLFGEESRHLEMQSHKEPHLLGVEPERVSRRALIETVGGAGPADVHSGLTEAIEHARRGRVRQVTGKVLRLFRRKLVKGTCGLSTVSCDIVSCDMRSAVELEEHKDRYYNN